MSDLPGITPPPVIPTTPIAQSLPSSKPKKAKKVIKIILFSILGFVVLCLVLFIIIGSSGMKENRVKTEVAETQTAYPTSTFTPLPTITLTPTITQTPTVTSTSTITPTATSTITPIPPYKLTQAALQITQTKEAANYLATKDSKNATATEIASYQEISKKELSTYPDNYIGQKLKVYGRVFNVIDPYTLQIYFAGTYDALVVSVDEPLSKIYEGDVVYVYGIGNGEWCGTNAMGGSICQPLIEKATIIKR